MIDGMFSGPINSMERALDVRAIRHEMLAGNVANAETPGYRALDIDFEATMERVMREEQQVSSSTRPSDSLQDALKIVADDAQSFGDSQNTVDMEGQMANLEQNALMFRITSQLAALRFNGLKDIINEGNR